MPRSVVRNTGAVKASAGPDARSELPLRSRVRYDTALAMNWPALGDETVDVLRRYLAIDTTNPPGNETEMLLDVAA